MRPRWLLGAAFKKTTYLNIVRAKSLIQKAIMRQHSLQNMCKAIIVLRLKIEAIKQPQNQFFQLTKDF